MNDKKTDYKSAGVDIKAGNEAVNLIKEKVKVLTRKRCSLALEVSGRYIVSKKYYQTTQTPFWFKALMV